MESPTYISISTAPIYTGLNSAHALSEVFWWSNRLFKFVADLIDNMCVRVCTGGSDYTSVWSFSEVWLKALCTAKLTGHYKVTYYCNQHLYTANFEQKNSKRCFRVLVVVSHFILKFLSSCVLFYFILPFFVRFLPWDWFHWFPVNLANC